jgi:hypothetical protein
VFQLRLVESLSNHAGGGHHDLTVPESDLARDDEMLGAQPTSHFIGHCLGVSMDALQTARLILLDPSTGGLRVPLVGQYPIALAALDDRQTSRAAASYGEAMAEMHRYGLYAPLTGVPALHREHLVEACRRSGVDVDETQHGVPPAIVPAPRKVERLSRAEHRVLVAIARHGSASATASALHLSVNTVWFHLKASTERSAPPVATRPSASRTISASWRRKRRAGHHRRGRYQARRRRGVLTTRTLTGYVVEG